MTKYTTEQIAVQEILSRNIGNILKELRILHGLSQGQLARANGFYQGRISALERGTYQPTFESIVNYLVGMGVAMGRLEICNDECPCKQPPELHTADGPDNVSGLREEES